jgi:hypothetical protein
VNPGFSIRLVYSLPLRDQLSNTHGMVAQGLGLEA